ncbi:MAG: 50S ribosomal protein L23 [Candidatus Levybacteria bacterium RIFCSPHIGHO2_02_FULL_40_18]|nr:MAG: 50S ribosomal protein L23 [Candidatus Levybacteria bacterium RIFCSPHIGHO2_01_FULL_40_58]OGH26386.1 MAG: 50S ribosomal protein L23 [Candidatus Levybacteria bacterium RIFCSPHIGHO2_02_FULL_40_18]OGH31833.1 MAG: 50S ribosomal protein L23 [Candidatus Levybacteria bacterium RIFCSPHIGHO2_12_FULL_40_31]OGH40466.1 MAG: 50S ribosomal protein L23 [Candidatus Levybacteria bacterium RIFCSPLOWO2_01_FULL_40_64]OGH49175.1 MAG: 50S ribosomal protein L23 [Candidatus Levybacteria bacterium RIFCSPLOWO2_02_
MNVTDYIIKPIVSEKSFNEAKNSNKYTFLVRRDATKTDIKNAIEKLFNVKVLRIYTAITKGKKTSFTRKGKHTIDQSYKKARVKLMKDQKIDIFEEQTDDKKKKGKK